MPEALFGRMETGDGIRPLIQKPKREQMLSPFSFPAFLTGSAVWSTPVEVKYESRKPSSAKRYYDVVSRPVCPDTVR
jgi:hypothetical protein